MSIILALLLIGVPLAEIALFIQIGGQIGIAATVAIVILTAILGTVLLRRQGLAVLDQARRDADEGRLPVAAVIDGVCLLAAGLLLLTPGFLTDTVGLALFVPPLRRRLARWTWARLVASGWVHAHAGRRGPDGGPVIEGEFREVGPARPPEASPGPEGGEGPPAGDRATPWRPPNGKPDA